MNENAYFVLLLITRFRAVSLAQLEKMVYPKFGRVTLYTARRDLEKNRLVTKTYLPETGSWIYQATDEGTKRIYRDMETVYLGLRTRDLSHQIACTDVLWNLARYSNITGITFEHELSPEDIQQFALNRRPDGVVQIGFGADAFEIAVEVETTQRNRTRVSELFSNYEKTLQGPYFCKGVLLFALHPYSAKVYPECLDKMDPQYRPAVRILKDSQAPNLNPAVYGIQQNSFESKLNLRRTTFNSSIEYLPMISTNTSLAEPHKSTYGGGQTDLDNEQGFYEKK